jgi:hypothetical protein
VSAASDLLTTDVIRQMNEAKVAFDHLTVTGKWIVDGNRIYFETFHGERQLSATFEDASEAAAVLTCVYAIPFYSVLVTRMAEAKP